MISIVTACSQEAAAELMDSLVDMVGADDVFGR